jgi:hypothetical protein
MKKIVTSILLSSLLFSCREIQEKSSGEIENVPKGFKSKYDIYILEGCEYIVAGYGSSRWSSHKGNCKNHPSCNSDSLKILKEELKQLKKHIIQLEEDNKIMGSELGCREFNK